MVATLVRLRLLVLANSLRRSTWQLVATVVGGLYALGLLALAVVGLIALGAFGSRALTSTIIVLAGTAVTAGWVVFPLLLSGIDQTLEPARLAQFPLRMRTLLIALTLAGLVGIPGIVTSLAGLSTALAWVRMPAAAAAAVVCAAIGVVTAVVASRTVTAATAGLQSSRRVRELGGVLILIPLFLLGPILIGLIEGIENSAEALPAVATALGWTPVGAAWAVPGAIAAGDVGGAVLRLLIAVATLVVLVAVWRAGLARAMVSRSDASARPVSRGALGVFGRVPQTPAGAVMARCLTYWRRDPRYARQLIVVPLVPLLLWFYAVLTETADLVMWSGPLIGFTLALTLATDISYDGTAFATHVIDGVRGRDDRAGRVAALAVFAIPFTIVLAVVGVALGGAWAHLPALMGLSLGSLLTGFGVVSVSSARFVMAVPEAGGNPFRSAPGASLTTGLQIFVVWGIVLALLVPTIALVVADLFIGGALYGWAALGCGVVTGALVMVGGIRAGGALLDRTAPSLLVQLRRLRGA
ncbi:transporter [Microbacterium terricola]|uniref:Transporter n=1 Tax=Microbacterium terricola TaxID=344163 RepID=A0ABM8DZE0_9MICO|nr:transporter [Microbacterium terricola]UYK41311.1 transporter [Microbacterium terricola]BDV30906.1 hypothetical protein Microterr_15660 [Microbacterium terricola]